MGKYNVNKLSVIYDKRQKDFVFKYPRRSDGALAINHICHDRLLFRLEDAEHKRPLNYETFNFVKELEDRGYDITTLRSSIELKKEKEINE